MNLDMTKGSPFKLIIRFILPLIAGNVFQQFYSMVDTIIVGRYVGVKALAAVGATGTINFLIFGFAMGLSGGFTVLTAQKYGAQDEDGVKKSVGSGLILSVLASAILTLLSVFYMNPLLRLLNTPDDIYGMSYDYIIVICYGLIACVFYNLIAGYLRAVGNSIAPLIFLIISAVLNIFLDLVLILNFHMGVAGAALATVLAQGISGIACLIYIIGKVPVLRIKRKHLKLHHGYVSTQLRIGIPMALQFSITAVGTLILQAALNLFGSIVIASYTAAVKAEQLLTQPFMAMGSTMATYAAQNYGQFDVGRIRKGTRIAVIMTVVYSLIIAVAANLLADNILGMFVSEGVNDILRYGETYILIVSIFFIPLGIIFVFRNVLQGMSFSFVAMLAGVMELAGRTVVALIAAHLMSYSGVCFASPVAWVMADLLLIPAFYHCIGKLKDQSTGVSRQFT